MDWKSHGLNSIYTNAMVCKARVSSEIHKYLIHCYVKLNLVRFKRLIDSNSFHVETFHENLIFICFNTEK
jgi:hypothetical protein